MKSIKTELKWAIIFILMSMAWIYVEKMTGLHDENIAQHLIYTNLFTIPAILVYIFALREKKKNYQHNFTYKKSFLSGLILSLMIALLAPLSTFMSVEYISPNFFSNIIAYSVENEIMTQTAALEEFNTQSYMLNSLMFSPIFGIVTTAIVAIFIRDKKKN